MADDTLYLKAESRIQRKLEFYKHFAIYCIVNILLAIVNYILTPNEWWFSTVTIFWGVGLVIHFISVFGLGGLFNDEWREKKINEEMEKMKK